MSTLFASALSSGVTALIDSYGYIAVREEVLRRQPATSRRSAPARHTDPETSHRAAKQSLDVSRFSARSRQAKLLYVFATGPRTDQEATVRVVGRSAVPSAFDGCRRRCSDLRSAGYLYDTGVRRRNAGSDDEAIVWGISRAGLDAIERLDKEGWSR